MKVLTSQFQNNFAKFKQRKAVETVKLKLAGNA